MPSITFLDDGLLFFVQEPKRLRRLRKYRLTLRVEEHPKSVNAQSGAKRRADDVEDSHNQDDDSCPPHLAQQAPATNNFGNAGEDAKRANCDPNDRQDGKGVFVTGEQTATEEYGKNDQPENDGQDSPDDEKNPQQANMILQVNSSTLHAATRPAIIMTDFPAASCEIVQACAVFLRLSANIDLLNIDSNSSL